MSPCACLADFVPSTLLVAVRMTAMCGTLPWLVELGISLRARLCFAAILTLLVAPAVGSTVGTSSWENPVAVVVGETVIGMSWGLGVGLLISSIRVAAELADAGSFYLWRNLLSNGEDGTGPGENQLFQWIALLTFLAVHGERQVLSAFLDSYENLPVGCALPASNIANGLVELLQQSLLVGWRIALPLGTAGLLGLMFVALVGRMSGSSGSFSASIPLLQIASIGLMGVALGPLSAMYGYELETLFAQIRDWFTN